MDVYTQIVHTVYTQTLSCLKDIQVFKLKSRNDKLVW